MSIEELIVERDKLVDKVEQFEKEAAYAFNRAQEECTKRQQLEREPDETRKKLRDAVRQDGNIAEKIHAYRIVLWDVINWAIGMSE